MLLTFEPSREGVGVDIVDRIERRRCHLETDRPVEPESIPTSEFEFPVDRGIRITAEKVRLTHTSAVHVRNQSGLVIDEITEGESRSYPADRYSLDVSAPIKLFFVVYDPLSITVTADEVILEFDEPTDVFVGARSYHKQPAATLTTTTDPVDMMEAVSTFGSALKTTTCERSFPTLRGHPPTVEIGDSLEIPSFLELPSTNVAIEIPPDHRSVFVTSSLAYYLGAELRVGSEPRIVTENGFEHRLDDPARGFEGEVERVLKQVFFLDCLTRTEGYYPVNLHERNALDGSVDLDYEVLYSQSLTKQLEIYLDVPFDRIEPHLPQWKLTAHVEVSPQNLELLPFVVNDLAIVRTHEDQSATDAPVPAGPNAKGITDGGTSQNFSLRSESETVTEQGFIHLRDTGPLDQTWIGEKMPLGASKAMIEAFKNGLDRSPTSGDIDITVVCNDIQMGKERDVVDQVYGSGEELPFDVSVKRELTKGELENVLNEDRDFLHYIGHIDEKGFECVDGWYDASELGKSGNDAFFLNACTSYQQGMNLIRAGSIAGVVTLDDVINSGAERVGRAFAKLLNYGFPLRAALNIAQEQSIIGGHYLVIGNGNIDISQHPSTVPLLLEVDNADDRDENLYDISITTFSSTGRGIGSLFYPFVKSNNKYYLSSGKLPKFEIERGELIDFIKMGDSPIKLNGKLYWTDQLDLDLI